MPRFPRHSLLINETPRAPHCNSLFCRVSQPRAPFGTARSMWRQPDAPFSRHSHVFSRLSASSDTTNSRTSPWQVTNYYTKKKSRPIDELGNIIDSPDNTAESFAWTPENKVRLAAIVLADALGRDPEDLIDNAKALVGVVPGGIETLQRLKPAEQVRLAAQLDTVPSQLIALREALPQQVDVAAVVSRWPEIMLLSIDQVLAAYQEMLDVFETEVGTAGVAAMLQTTPLLLDGRTLKECIRGAGHLMPLRQLADSLARYSDYWMQFATLEKEPRNDYDAVLQEDEYYLRDYLKEDAAGS